MRYFMVILILGLFLLPTLAQDDSLTPYEIALQRIEEAEANGTTSLDLSNLGLTELPLEIANLRNLQELRLNNNQLSSLPPALAYLPNLQILSLENNPLISPPPEVVAQGTEAILDYIRNEAEASWNSEVWMLRGAMLVVGLVLLALLLGYRWRNREKTKND